MRCWLYLRVLKDLNDIHGGMELWHSIYDEPQTSRNQRAYVSPDEVIKQTRYPRWLVKWAVRWQERQRLRNEKPPFSL